MTDKNNKDGQPSRINLSRLNEDFSDFNSSDIEFSVPQTLSQKINLQVEEELNPNSWYVLSRLSLIHLFSAVFTLTICPQFGFGLFGVKMGLMHIFALFGETICYALCGAFFVGTTLVLASLLLESHELRLIRKKSVLQLAAIIFLSLGFFTMLRPEIVGAFGVIWFLGSLLGGMAVLELGWWIRMKALS